METKKKSRGSVMLEKRRAVNSLEVMLSPCLLQYDKCHNAAIELVEYGVRTKGKCHQIDNI